MSNPSVKGMLRDDIKAGMWLRVFLVKGDKEIKGSPVRIQSAVLRRILAIDSNGDDRELYTYDFYFKRAI